MRILHCQIGLFGWEKEPYNKLLDKNIEILEFNSDVDKNQVFVENLKRQIRIPPFRGVIRLIIMDEVSEQS